MCTCPHQSTFHAENHDLEALFPLSRGFIRSTSAAGGIEPFWFAPEAKGMSEHQAPLLNQPSPSAGTTAQLLRAILVSLAWAFDAQQTFISVFTDAEPSWHCTTTTNSTCSSTSASPCNLPDSAWSWDHPPRTSIISEWSLQCASPTLVGLPASAYFAGCLAGGLLLTTLADSLFGRKRMLFLSCLTMSLSAALTSLSPNIWVYAALRFVSGIGRSSIGASAIVLSNETAAEKWRDKISIVCYLWFTLGFLSLPAIAYTTQESSWRMLYLWTSVPGILYAVLVHIFAHESPRWLAVRRSRELGLSKETTDLDAFEAIRALWSKKWAFRRLGLTMIVSFGCGVVYYGMPLNSGNLGSNIYLSVTFNALAELPSSLVTYFVIRWLNRRSSSMALTTLSGVLSLLCVFVTAKAPRLAVEVVAFFASCTAFNVVLIYSIELFPTCVRNSAVSLVRQALVLGGVIAPVLVAAGRTWSALTFWVFGLAIGCCGLFVAGLPETKGGRMSDTMEEEEYKEVLPGNQVP